jgi:hypothetical protein
VNSSSVTQVAGGLYGRIFARRRRLSNSGAARADVYMRDLPSPLTVAEICRHSKQMTRSASRPSAVRNRRAWRGSKQAAASPLFSATPFEMAVRISAR